MRVMTRLFIAVDAPDDVRDRLAALKRPLEGARWVPREQLHLTLRFIGDADDNRLQEIKDALKDVQIAPFSVALSGVGQFPKSGRAHVIWAGLSPTQEVTALAAAIEDALERAGLEREQRKFSPHLTLARLKEAPQPEVKRFLEEQRGLSSDLFTIDHFHLYASALSPKGATHAVVESYALR